MKRLVLILMTMALGAAGCGGVKTGPAADADGGATGGDHRADAAPGDGDDRIDGGAADADDAGTVGDMADAGATDDSCVFGTSQLGNCSL